MTKPNTPVSNMTAATSKQPQSSTKNPILSPVTHQPIPTADIEESTIHFTKSNISCTWSSKRPIVILRVAEEAGLKPKFGCRSGICGACEVKLLKGTVLGPEGDYDRGIFICSSRPTSTEVEIEL